MKAAETRSGMSVKIRMATINDAELIAHLNQDVQAVHAKNLPRLFKNPYINISEFDDALRRPDYFAFIAFDKKIAAGYVLAEHYRKAESPRHNAYEMIYVHHISVRSEFRRQGVGKALLDAAKERGKESGIDLFALDVWSFNDEARTFFQKYGLITFIEKMWMKVE
jgi:ribosomal protein S18 acetylase RimI-like enzyme